MRHLRTAVCFVLLSLSFVVEARSYHGRVRKLERTVRNLIEDVEELRKEDVKIRSLLMNTTQANFTSNNQSMYNTTTPDNKTNSTSCALNHETHVKKIQINQIESDKRSENVYNISYSFTLGENEPTVDTFAYWNYHRYMYGYATINRTAQRLRDDSLSVATLKVVAENNSSVRFVFGTNNTWYALQFNNSIPQSKEQNVTLPELYVTPNEIVKTENGSTKFKVVVSSDISLLDNFSLSESIVYSKELSRVTRDWVPPIAPTSYDYNGTCGPNRTIANMDWQNVTFGYSGVLNLMVEKNIDSDLKYVQVYRSVIFRPYNQSGPFPDHVFQFVPHQEDTQVKPGRFVHYCMKGGPCPVICTAVGSNVTNITIRQNHKILKKLEIKSPLYITEAMVNAQTIRPSRIICEATDQTGRSILHVVHVRFMSQPRRPLLKVRNDKGNSRLIAECRTRGTPKPHITFHVQEDGFGDQLYYGSDLTTSTTYQNLAWVEAEIPYNPVRGPPKVACEAYNQAGSSKRSWQ